MGCLEGRFIFLLILDPLVYRRFDSDYLVWRFGMILSVVIFVVKNNSLEL